MKNLLIYKSKFCNLFIIEENDKICRVSFDGKKSKDIKQNETPLLKKAAKQFDEYFAGKRKSFDLPLALNGTDFQISVWNVLLKIPYGKTRCYGEIAAQAGNPKACRAAGMANNRNPMAIIIPCHRVIGKDGKLTGYAGGLELKQKLLDLEKNQPC